MLSPGPALGCITLAHGQDPWSSATSSTSGGACSGLDPFIGLYIRTAKLLRGILVVTSIFRSLAGASSSSSSATSPLPDSSNDYPEIGVGACGDFVVESRLICMVDPNKDSSRNNSSRYPPLGDRRRLMPEHPTLDWFKI
jgi:hypothetical protein